MARQKGIITLKGSIGYFTFCKTSQDGHFARENGGIEKSRIQSDPAFQKTRENGSEFGRAGEDLKTLRTAMRALLNNSGDGRMVSRLTQAIWSFGKTVSLFVVILLNIHYYEQEQYLCS